MKRLYRMIALFLSIICSVSIPVHAKNARGHDKDLELVLFGSTANKDQKAAAKVLEAAAYLTIDQFGGDGQGKLDLLNEALSDVDYPSIEKIDISSSETSHHREYTHQGWDSKYRKIQRNNNQGIDEEWPQRWELRKEILIDTVEGVFEFNWWNDIPFIGGFLPEYDERCDSLCALVYYTHLLGDHLETEKIAQYNYLMPVGGKLNGKDIIHELLYHCEALFPDSSVRKGREYARFEDKLNSVNSKYYKLGTINEKDSNVNEKLVKNQEYAEEIMEILQEYIPFFIEEENFYSKIESFGNVA